ncbi:MULTISPECIES: DUF2267 domain-containing protein [unclassified Streptomyces]|uniref:DUF2267 domain-containing protein n=1 Tax=unclassified Streptomyces TaxID=2593676 RepID=UPI00324E8A43
MRWSELVEEVRERGEYPTTKEAERITKIVLSTLGGHLTGPAKDDLVKRLPVEAATVITEQVPVIKPLTGTQFVDSVAARIDGATPTTARWDVSSVLSAVADAAGDELTERIIRLLPPGYALLFGRVQLAA